MSRVGYLELLRTNADYRRIWIGDVASLLGDWFNTVALYTLVRELTGSPLALGLVMITKSLPFALASPLAGLLTDRFNRRRLMIAADLARAAVVLGLVLVDRPAEVPLLYVLAAVQMMIGAVFIPARSASIPNITSGAELLTANALSAATWSTLLAIGAALGGLVTDWIGIQAVFALDSLSYLVSAAFITRAVIPQHTAPANRAEHRPRQVVADIVDGWHLLRRDGRIGRIALTKTSWAVGGSGLVYMLALLGERLLPGAPAVGIGLLYAARGLGTGIGPIAARAFVPDERHWPTLMGLGLLASGAAYVGAGAIPWSFYLLPLVMLAHTPSGANWVMSTVLLQRRTGDRYRGRVFATEWLLLTLTDSAGVLVASLLLESGWLGLRAAVLLFAGVMMACGLAWLAWVVPAERRAWRTEAVEL